ncbi:MAG: translation initiation factor IF-2 [Planctomycetota bacterium]
MTKKSTNIRVYELATELGKSGKDILEAGKRLNLEIKDSASASLDPGQVEAITRELQTDRPRQPRKLSLAVQRPVTPAAEVKPAPPPEPPPAPAPAVSAAVADAATGTKAPAARRVLTAADVKRTAKIKKRKDREAEEAEVRAVEEAKRKAKKAAQEKARPTPPPVAAPAAQAMPVTAGPAPVATAATGPTPAPVPPPAVMPPPKPAPRAVPPVERPSVKAQPKTAAGPRPVYRMMGNRQAPVEEERPSEPLRGREFIPRQEGAGRRRRRGPRRNAAATPGQPVDTRRRSGGRGRSWQGAPVPPVPRPAPVILPPPVAEVFAPISLREFSQLTGIKVQSIIIKLLDQGMISNINTVIDRDTVEYIAELFERQITFKDTATPEDHFLKQFQLPDDPATLQPRIPIVTFLGHVDHGKTSLLDRIRGAGVAKTEHGGITQHTSAYTYNKGGRSITFIDTPGHAIFTAMRSRGANVTDIVVLVVAADDGVMPQTREAYDHAVAAKVPVVVAMNKCDLPSADPNRVKGQLAEMGLTAEDWGGTTQIACVSAQTGDGMDDLLSKIMLEAEIIELKANPARAAHGVVLESNLSGSQGVVVSLVVKNGTLKKGDCFICGTTYGRIRHIWDPAMTPLNEAGPSLPVRATGFNAEPVMGDHLFVTTDYQQAKAIAEKRAMDKATSRAVPTHVTLATLFDNISQQKLRELNIIVKVDAKGSLEAILKGIAEIGNKEVSLRVVHAGVGGINESDVMLADASNAIILGFHVATEPRVDVLAEQTGIEIRRYHVIYELFKEMSEALSGMLEPERVEEIIGRVEVRRTFNVSSVGTIAGCYVLKGVVKKSANVRLIRDSIEVYEGTLASLKRTKDDASEVKEHFECGIKLRDFDDIKIGDELEVYQFKEVKRTLATVSGRK